MEKNAEMIAALFTTATRKKFRFPFRGMISIEDLWDLSVQNLDAVFKALNAEAKVAKEESLLETKTEKDVILEAKIEIVKYIVAVKQDEAAKREQAATVREQKRQIQELIAQKQNAELQGKSIEELQDMLSKLDV
jgi:gamma-glutamylcysteine synthetase